MIAAYIRWLVGVALVAFGGLLALLTLFVWLIFWSTREAHSQSPGDHGFMHRQGHDWYKGLKQPHTGQSCCNGDSLDSNGDPVAGDCRPTRAHKVGGTWMALIDGEYYPVPSQVVMPSSVSGQPFMAHICASRPALPALPIIYCFIEKEGGG